MELPKASYWAKKNAEILGLFGAVSKTRAGQLVPCKGVTCIPHIPSQPLHPASHSSCCYSSWGPQTPSPFSDFWFLLCFWGGSMGRQCMCVAWGRAGLSAARETEAAHTACMAKREVDLSCLDWARGERGRRPWLLALPAGRKEGEGEKEVVPCMVGVPWGVWLMWCVAQGLVHVIPHCPEVGQSCKLYYTKGVKSLA